MPILPSSAPHLNPPPPPKLRRLPATHRIQKRPLLHPAIPSPYTSSLHPKTVYISTNTPFISAVKRVRKLLALTEKRFTGPISLVNDTGKNASDKQRLEALERRVRESREGIKEREEVLLKGTNRAIEKVMGLGCFFQQEAGMRIRVRTGTVGAVDDVVEEEERGKKRRKGKRKDTGDGVEGEGKAEDEEMEGVEEEVPETQIRRVSVLEIGISLV
ncbi:MAG: hypothetical protein Q9220_005165 [cf. Caloplaca sp. 1 TL-2023]